MMSKSSHMALLETALDTRRSVLLVGPPGVGKTYTVRRIAEQRGWTVITLIASIREPVDFLGLPYRDNGTTRYAAPAWAAEVAANPDRRYLLFFDEIDKAPPSVQAACLRIADERVVGDDCVLPPETRIVFAANPPEFGGHPLIEPLVTRLLHVEWRPTPREMGEAIAACAPEIAAVRGVDPVQAAHYGALIGTLVERRGTMLEPPTDKARRSRPWATPRTLTHLAVGLAYVTDSERNALVLAEVGEGFGHELIAFLRETSLPDPEDLLSGKVPLGLDDRSDRSAALLTSLVAAVAAKPTAKRWQRAADLLGEAAKSHADLAVSPLRRLVQIRKANSSLQSVEIPESIASVVGLLKGIGVIG